ncbi:MAG: arginine--tRNA ligase [Alphaproteobacteria bacterium]
MNIFAVFKRHIDKILQDLVAESALPDGMDTSKIAVEPPRDASHGDISTNAAMVLSKAAKMAPRDIAALITDKLHKLDDVSNCSIAGPGFINITVQPVLWSNILQDILQQGTSFGDSTLGKDQNVNVEYVSVNPTGPMHIGHSRVAIVGDVVASLLQKAGYTVTKEFYINDAGGQADQLARSLYGRYCQELGQADAELGEYPADYLIAPAKKLAERDGDKWLGKDISEWMDPVRSFAIDEMMDMIRQDLDIIGIHHDVFASEKAIIESGGIETAFKILNDKGLIYQGTLPKPKGIEVDDWEPRELTLFRTTEFGDDSDRPLKKSDGSWTYVTGDIAYHNDKIKRGFNRIVNVWGSDHVGYVKRMAAATNALSDGRVSMEAILCNMVHFMDNGVAVKMSKRAGTFVTMADVIDRVGRDVVRFIMLTRKNDIPLEFDFAKVVEQSKDNPVYYVQYAHARSCSIRRHVEETFPGARVDQADLSLLTREEDIAMMKTLAQWPRQVEVAAQAEEPHRIAFFLYEVASQFHALWTKGKGEAELRFVYPNDKELTLAKLALVQAVATVIASGLDVMGVTPAEEM